MNARTIKDFRHFLLKNGIELSDEEAEILLRAERTLRHWYEQECGDSDDYKSWCIVRDEETNKPYREVSPHTGKSYRVRINDMETPAIRRIARVCEDNDSNLYYYYIQTDPRGCSVYISKSPIDQSNYTQGIACCID